MLLDPQTRQFSTWLISKGLSFSHYSSLEASLPLLPQARRPWAEHHFSFMEVDRKHLCRSWISCWDKNEDPLIPPVPSLPVIINPMLLKFGSGVGVLCKALMAWRSWGCSVTVQGVVGSYLCNTELSTHRTYSHLLCPSFWMGNPGSLIFVVLHVGSSLCLSYRHSTSAQQWSISIADRSLKQDCNVLYLIKKEMLYGVTFVQICIFIAAS